jgi:hypothetical protein
MLTVIVDHYVKDGDSTKKALDKQLACVNDIYNQVLVCSSAVTNAVFRSVSSRQYLSGQRIIDTQEKARADMEQQCPSQQAYLFPACAELR